MALSCQPNNLASLATCFKCLSITTSQHVQTYLLCQLLSSLGMTASCDTNALAAAAKCYKCLDPSTLLQVQVLLLARIAGVTTNPSALAQLAASFQGMPDVILNDIDTYLLCQVTSSSNNPAFNPLNVAGMQQWFSADFGITLGTGQNAINVADQSGNNRPLFSADGVQTPQLTPNALGTHPGLHFASATNQGYGFVAFDVGNTFYTLLVVKTDAAASVLFGWTGGGTNRQISCSAANAGVKCFDGTNTVISNAVNVSAQYGLIVVTLNAGTMTCKYNGVVIPMTTPSGLLNSMLIQGLGTVVGVGSDMTVLEGMIFKPIPGASDQASLENYLRNKYALY